MKFLVSMIDDGTWLERATPGEFQAMVDQMNDFIEVMEKEGAYVGGEGLGPREDAKTLRHGENGKIVVTDGPYAESKEQVGGYMIIECKNMDEAIDWIKRMPATDRDDGAVEIRPVFDSADEVAEAYGKK